MSCKMPKPTYSIIITCYNQREFIRDAVESALSQAGPAKEVIVVDDGSSDGSLDLLREFEPAIHLIALSTNQGASTARNHGAAVATGTYLLFLDGDDLLTPWALDVYERLLTVRKPLAILGTAKRFEGPIPQCDGAFPDQIHFLEYRSLLDKDRSHGINIGAFLIDRSIFQAAGGWTPEIFQLDGQDLYAKLALSGPALIIDFPYTMLYRMHDANSIRSVAPFMKSAHLIIKREHAGLYPGGAKMRFARYARHGGVVAFCVKRAMLAHLYREAMTLVLSGWAMICAAVLRRATALARGRRPLEVLQVMRPNGVASRAHFNV